MSIKVGQQVLCHGKVATVKFVGETSFASGIWVGVAFDKPHGKNDGSVQGKRYFDCPKSHGLFVRESTLKPFDDKERAATLIQSMARGDAARAKTREQQAFALWNSLDEQDESEALQKNREVGLAVDTAIRRQAFGENDGRDKRATLRASMIRGDSVPLDGLGEETVPESYTGPHLSIPPRREECIQYLEHLQANPDVLLHRKYAWQILNAAESMLDESHPSSVYMFEIPKGDKTGETRMLLCGDTHGQLNDLLWLFYKFGPPGPNNVYLFNGDIADRGRYSVEIFLLLLAFKICCPHSVIINRGNHESEDMNEVYGFAQECRRKYGGMVYHQFQEIFYRLPLAIVIDKRIICVHGGLSRRDGVTLKMIDSLDRARPCPEAPTSYQDLLMFDLLWSDPMADQGRRKSPRGIDCVMFGPDVTDRFLTRNRLEVCIRSHQVPTTGRGFEVHHDGKCVTVFSASNYCGTSNNYGGVIVFQPDLSFEIQEYWAPSLEEIQQLAAETKDISNRVAGAFEKKLRAVEKRASQDVMRFAAERMEKDSLKKIAQMIIEKKSDLWYFFWNSDSAKTGTVDPQVWREGCSAVLGEHLPWHFLQKSLNVVDNELVDYNKFLKRFVADFQPVDSAGRRVKAKWKEDTVQHIFEAILRADLSVRETLLLLDRNSDGTVSFAEFADFIRALRLPLSEPQMRALMRMICSTHTMPSNQTNKAANGQATAAPAASAEGTSGPRLHVAQFLAKFKVCYPVDSFKSKEPWLQTLLAEIGRLILTEAHERNMKQAVENRRKSSFRAIHMLGKFQQADKTGVGYLSFQDFVVLIKQLPLKNVKGLGFQITDQHLLELAKAVDLQGTGQINYTEFLNAFFVVDRTADGGKAAREKPQGKDSSSSSSAVALSEAASSNEVFSEICATLVKHRTVIKRACRHFDPELMGVCDPDELRQALSTLNDVLAQHEAPLTEEQIDEICDLCEQDSGGNANYEAFLDAFVIVDTQEGAVWRVE